MGYERNRSDYCVSVWDTQNMKEICMFGLSDSCQSICWDKQATVLYSGLNHKHIKSYDLRAGNNALTTTSTRSVYGLSMSPNGRYLASYIDNVVHVWDIRNMDKAVAHPQMQRHVNSLSWCPTRTSVLTTLQRDSPYVHLLDLYWTNNGVGAGNGDNSEPHSTRRDAAPFRSKVQSNGSRSMTIKNVSWHPTDIERMLVMSGSGAIVDFQVPQRIVATFDARNGLWGTVQGNNIDLLYNGSVGETAEEQDILPKIYKRALADYGLLQDTNANGDLALSQELAAVWRLLGFMSRDDWSGGGLKMKLAGGNGSHQTNLPWSDLMTGQIKAYRSDQRDAAIQMCGWSFNRDKEGSFVNFIEEMAKRGERTKAAFIATVHLRIRYAIEVLGNGATSTAQRPADSNTYRMAAIALSGFSLEKSGIWRTQCSLAQSQIDDAYLRGVFGFLAADSESYENVLNESGISLADRMAFACIFLNDQKLLDYVKAMIHQCIGTGDLNGLLLTGASAEGINLLQSHLDLTDDVQTVALIAVRCMPIDLLDDVRVAHWIKCYRDLLNVWELWEKRAQLDLFVNTIKPPPPKSSKSVFLMCSFCGKNVSGNVQEDVRVRANAAQVNKQSSCPSCRKPLPRCSLCLLHMGTTSAAISSPSNILMPSMNKPRPFSTWFSWCQTCRHGGHTEHLAQWFEKHTECPVTSCSCKCFAMDFMRPGSSVAGGEVDRL